MIVIFSFEECSLWIGLHSLNHRNTRHNVLCYVEVARSEPIVLLPVFGQMPSVWGFNTQLHKIPSVFWLIVRKWHAFKTFLRTVVIMLLMMLI